LAASAGLTAAQARIVLVEGAPVAAITRFDREADDGRTPYQSAASMLQAARDDERSYTDIADVIRSYALDPARDLTELWRRMAFNLLITNTDDHLRNHGFLHVAHGLWCLAPAFDLNPFPDRDRESKTWLAPVDGPISDIRALLGRCDHFGLTVDAARAVLAHVVRAVRNWRELAVSPDVGMSKAELTDFAPAFEHDQVTAATTLL
jgi:serine/threonine-protein kinase HipA